MPPIQPENYSLPNYTNYTQNMPEPITMAEPGPSLLFIIFGSLSILLLVILITSFIFPKLKKHRKKIIAGLVISVIVTLMVPPYEDSVQNNNTYVEPGSGPPVLGSEIEGKIHGVWAHLALAQELEYNSEHMKEVGINTITFSPLLMHDEEGKIIEEENSEKEAKKIINLAHSAGIQIMLEPSPMKSEVSPEVIDPELFKEEMEKVTLKYAKIAEEYNVAYFSPLSEPVHHLGPDHADEFMQDILPKIREVYSGEIVYKKTSIDLATLREWDQDHIFTAEFKLEPDGFLSINMQEGWNKKQYIQITEDEISFGEFENNQGGELFKETININDNQWHIIKIENSDAQTKIYLDEKMIIEYQGETMEFRGYMLNGNDFLISDLEIEDFPEDYIFNEDFETTNNWVFIDGNWAIENGELIGSGEGEALMIYDLDFSGYDYLAINMFREGTEETDEEYREYVKNLILRTKQQADADGVSKILLGEFGGTVYPVKDWGATEIDESPPMTNEQLAQTTRIVLEEAENITDGYFYNGWILGGQGMAVIPEVEVVIKDWYNNH